MLVRRAQLGLEWITERGSTSGIAVSLMAELVLACRLGRVTGCEPGIPGFSDMLGVSLCIFVSVVRTLNCSCRSVGGGILRVTWNLKVERMDGGEPGTSALSRLGCILSFKGFDLGNFEISELVFIPTDENGKRRLSLRSGHNVLG